MTNFSQVIGSKKRGGNIKDGHHPNRARTKAQRRADDAQWLAAGFEYRWIRGAPRLVYTWGGNFPTFEVTPGIVGVAAGMVARYPQADIEILFAYGTPPGDIAARLNDEIERIMFHDAEIDEQPLKGEDWIDIDGFMKGLWVRS
jgi:hypothetical protein